MDLTIAARAPRAARAGWGAHLQMSGAFYCQDPWRPPVGPGRPLHWVGRALEGSVLPDHPR